MINYKLPYSPEVLSYDEIRALIKKYKEEKDYDAYDKIIIHNAKLVFSIVLKDYKKFGEIRDLISAGMHGLIISIDKYDLNRDTAFPTYARHWIKCEIRKYIAEKRIIKIPPASFTRIIQVQKFIKSYEKIHQCSPTDKQIRDAITSDTDSVSLNLIRIFKIHLKSILSLDSTTAENDNNTDSNRYDFLIDRVDSPYESIMISDDKIQLINAINKLTTRDQYIIHTRYFDNKTLDEVSKVVGITRERVRQLQSVALLKLKKYIK